MRHDPSRKRDDPVPLRPVEWTRICPHLTWVHPVIYFQYLSIREVRLAYTFHGPYQTTRCHNPEAHNMNHHSALKTVTKLTKFAESCDAFCASWADSKLSYLNSFLIRMRNISEQSCIDNQNTHFMFSDGFFFLSKIVSLWDNVERYCTVRQATDGACALHAGYPRLQTQTSEEVIIISFPLQQQLYEGVSMLRCTYIACIVYQVT
jgi:hypothetical protein